MAKEKLRSLVYYDGWCPICQRSVRLLRRFDWLKKLDYISIRDYHAINNFPIPYYNLEKRLHIYDPNRREFKNGIFAVKEIMMKVPLFWFLIPFIQLSILFGLGQRMYDFIAKHRGIFPTGCTDNCQLQPPDQKKHHS